jgi:hypothetical protein
MKRFMFASIGLLCLSLSALIGFHIGHQTAHAGYVAHDESGLIGNNNLYNFLDEHGTVWTFEYGDGWWSSPEVLPVTASQIKFWTQFQIVTVDNVGWSKDSEGWHLVGPWPGGQPVPTDNSSWGAIKSKLKGSD